MWIVNILQRRKVRQIHSIVWKWSRYSYYDKEKRFLNGILTVTLNSRVSHFIVCVYQWCVMCGILLMFIAYLKRKYLCITICFWCPSPKTFRIILWCFNSLHFQWVFGSSFKYYFQLEKNWHEFNLYSATCVWQSTNRMDGWWNRYTTQSFTLWTQSNTLP